MSINQDFEFLEEEKLKFYFERYYKVKSDEKEYLLEERQMYIKEVIYLDLDKFCNMVNFMVTKNKEYIDYLKSQPRTRKYTSKYLYLFVKDTVQQNLVFLTQNYSSNLIYIHQFLQQNISLNQKYLENVFDQLVDFLKIVLDLIQTNKLSFINCFDINSILDDIYQKFKFLSILEFTKFNKFCNQCKEFNLITENKINIFEILFNIYNNVVDSDLLFTNILNIVNVILNIESSNENKKCNLCKECYVSKETATFDFLNINSEKIIDELLFKRKLHNELIVKLLDARQIYKYGEIYIITYDYFLNKISKDQTLISSISPYLKNKIIILELHNSNKINLKDHPNLYYQLIEADLIDINSVNQDNQSLYLQALNNNHHNLVELLIQKGANMFNF